MAQQTPRPEGRFILESDSHASPTSRSRADSVQSVLPGGDMALTTSLEGRVRNTSLPKTQALLPVMEAVVGVSWPAAHMLRSSPTTGLSTLLRSGTAHSLTSWDSRPPDRVAYPKAEKTSLRAAGRMDSTTLARRLVAMESATAVSTSFCALAIQQPWSLSSRKSGTSNERN